MTCMELSMTTKIKANLQSFQNAETSTNRFSTASYRCRMNRVRKGKSNQGFDMTDAPRSGPVNFTWQIGRNSMIARNSRHLHGVERCTGFKGRMCIQTASEVRKVIDCVTDVTSKDMHMQRLQTQPPKRLFLFMSNYTRHHARHFACIFHFVRG